MERFVGLLRAVIGTLRPFIGIGSTGSRIDSGGGREITLDPGRISPAGLGAYSGRHSSGSAIGAVSVTQLRVGLTGWLKLKLTATSTNWPAARLTGPVQVIGAPVGEQLHPAGPTLSSAIELGVGGVVRTRMLHNFDPTEIGLVRASDSGG